MATLYPVIASYLGTESEAPSSSWADSLALLFKDINSKYAFPSLPTLLLPLNFANPFSLRSTTGRQKDVRLRGASQLQAYVRKAISSLFS